MRVSIAKARIIGAVLLCAWLLAGCSVVRVAYNQAPTLGWWWLDGYLDFPGAQAPRVKAVVNDWFEWHRRTQLPDYAALLAAAQAQVLQPATPEQVCRWNEELRARAAVALAEGLQRAGPVLAALTPEQLAHLEKRYRKSNQGFQEEFLQEQPEERQKAALKRTVDRVEMLYGSIDERQRQLLAEGIAASPFDPSQWYGERQALQRETLQVLRQVSAPGASRAEREAQQARLEALTARLLRSPNPAYRAYQQRLTDYNCGLIARFHNSTTTAQRQAAKAKLKGWEEDLRALMAQPAATAQAAERLP